MFSEDVVGLIEEMGFSDDWCCNVEAQLTELSSAIGVTYCLC